MAARALAVGPQTHRASANLRDSHAAPVVVVQAGLQFMGVVDTLMVARLAADALARVALGSFWLVTVAVLGAGTLMALDPVVSQALGAVDSGGARRGIWPVLVEHPAFEAS